MHLSCRKSLVKTRKRRNAESCFSRSFVVTSVDDRSLRTEKLPKRDTCRTLSLSLLESRERGVGRVLSC